MSVRSLLNHSFLSFFLMYLQVMTPLDKSSTDAYFNLEGAQAALTILRGAAQLVLPQKESIIGLLLSSPKRNEDMAFLRVLSASLQDMLAAVDDIKPIKKVTGFACSS